ncbi:MAG: putative multidrug resistance protein NorM [Pseudomonadota bacterium]|jgi:MATE family multidrug resistance protein|uniref:MATE family efflux transporter n=1 Tax=Pseudaquabacterium rugosum TaxID=2984194 RepID=A0ABU9B743_9BURK
MFDRHGIPQERSRLESFGREAQQFFALGLPMVVSRLGLAAMAITDGVMLAHHSSRQLAVHGLADAVMGRWLEVGMAFVMAGLTLAAQAAAGNSGERQLVGRTWHQALLLAFMAGLLGMALGAFAPTLFAWTGQEAVLAADAGLVLAVLGLGMLPAMVAMATAGVLEAVGHASVVALAVVMANLLNFWLNGLWIDGSGTVPALGAVGAAWATTVVRGVLAVVLLAAAWWLPQRHEFGLRRRFRPADWRASQEQRGRGWNAALSTGLLALLACGLPVIAGWLGERPLAAMTALFVLLAPLMVMAWGLADAAGLQVAGVMGMERRRPGMMLRTGDRCALLQALVVAGFALLMLALAPPLLALVAPDPALARLVRPLLPLGIVVVLAEGLAFLYAAQLRSIGELRRPLLIQAVAGLLLLPLAWVLAFQFKAGLGGLLAAQGIAAALRAFALATLYRQVGMGLDKASAEELRRRAQASARAWADTVLIRPVARTQVAA